MAEAAEAKAAERLREADRVAERNQWKVIRAFQKHKVSETHFADSTGYGYNDRGRETLDAVFADIFGAEAALVRPHIVSGTHAIAVALFGLLRPGDELVFVAGSPYDTLHPVIGRSRDGSGSLADWGVISRMVPLLSDGRVDWSGVKAAAGERTKVFAIQRSRGYSWRPSFTVDEIEEMARRLKEIKPDAVVFVDNCYGEFVEEREPTEAGADLVAGSLIKNPGGGLAPTGGYIAGRRELVDRVAARLTAPGIGAEIGAMLGTTRALFQGLFLAPLFVNQAVKGSIFAAAVFGELGYETRPAWHEQRTDLIQAIRFRSREQLIAFVRAVQRAAAVDAHVVPEPAEMPGYDDPVIMAAGTFIQGGSLELSADAPLREPYIAYMQGGLAYAQVKLAVRLAVEALSRVSDSLT
ncbi:MAG: hypothetical protein BAA02_11055 [Paenibacillaceae bacterium ZCTH02-B3]|nr:MAG: hypothetical protein BAA02_11055 [Paenibacillaceae bacterium ZCTH02-B3]